MSRNTISKVGENKKLGGGHSANKIIVNRNFKNLNEAGEQQAK